MNIIPHDRTIHMLLNNPIEQLIVPSYQRRYAWEDKQTAFLFEDIDMLLKPMKATVSSSLENKYAS